MACSVLELLQANPELPFDVLLTTYELAMADVKFLSRMRWCYAIIDEAQRLKNANSVCALTIAFAVMMFEAYLSRPAGLEACSCSLDVLGMFITNRVPYALRHH